MCGGERSTALTQRSLDQQKHTAAGSQIMRHTFTADRRVALCALPALLAPAPSPASSQFDLSWTGPGQYLTNVVDLARDATAPPTSMDELVDRSEVLSLHIPLDDTTRGLYSADVLDRMRDDAVLINTCRGGIIDEIALKERLLDGRLAAACIDAFTVEPPTDDELLNAPNFLCTPHIGGSAAEARLAMGRAAIDGIEDNFLPEPGIFPFA